MSVDELLKQFNKSDKSKYGYLIAYNRPSKEYSFISYKKGEKSNTSNETKDKTLKGAILKAIKWQEIQIP